MSEDMMNNETRRDTQEFSVRDILAKHCGVKLTPDNVEFIVKELCEMMVDSPTAWAFQHDPNNYVRPSLDFRDGISKKEREEKCIF